MKQCLELIAAILILSCAGCASCQQSETTRAASFEPHAGRLIDQVDAGTFLRSRVALLISSDQDLSTNWLAGDTKIPPGSDLGCAVAVDPRGYFLTVAHCLSRKFVFLIVYDSQGSWGLHARIVCRGNSRKGRSDLAILHVRRKLEHTFDQADEARPDETVMAVGLSWTNNPSRNLQGFELMGGSILDSRKLEAEESDFNVATDVPLQSGDSGGPLVDLGGRLIGINVKGTPPLVHYLLPKTTFPMLAEHPSRKWLQQTIEEDVARYSIETAVQHYP